MSDIKQEKPEVVPQRVTIQRVAVFGEGTLGELESEINSFIEDATQGDRWAGGEASVIAAGGGSYVGYVNWVEILRVDFIDSTNGQVLRSVTPGGLELAGG